MLRHIKKLDDCFGQFLVRVSCPCGASRYVRYRTDQLALAEYGLTV